MLPVAVQFYSVRDDAEKDFYDTLKKIKEMGYEGVEFAGLFDHSPEEVRDMCKEIGIVPVSAHVPLDDMIADAKGTLEAYKTIGCDYVAVPYITEERRPGAEKWDETVAAIKEIGAVARDMGLTLLYHNHDFEFVKIDGEYGLDVLYDSVPADCLQTELDTCWVNVGGEVPAEYILKYTGRAPVVHLKDFVMKGKDKPMKLYDLIGIDDEAESADEDDFSFKPVGYGVQDFPAILASAEKAGAKWVVVEQDQPDKGNTPLNAVKMSIEYLRKLGE
ncbi:MAG: sugar phosphate isomerase/epimerase [Clostridia bacterium]|nr:sugar phosphate isomerase/epimerase [Clostridia bacterium]